MINFCANIGELSFSYTIALEVLRCDYESSVSRMCMVNASCPNLALQTCLSSKVVGVVMGILKLNKLIQGL